jgi:hypothetical protein
MITTIQNWIAAHRERVFLRKHGCENRAQYNRRYDPGVNYQANFLDDFYPGYQVVWLLESRDHYAYHVLWDHGPGGWRGGYHDIMDWCTQHCAEKFRFDMHRMFFDGYSGKWVLNGIGNGDYYCVAFQSELDAAQCKLRWT